MPNITIEYTANIAEAVEANQLASKLHLAAHELGCFPSNGIRTFARSHDQYLVGHCRGSEAFIQIQVHIAPGRSRELLSQIMNTLFKAAVNAMAEQTVKRELGIQLEVTEFSSALTRSHNTISTD
ncbi:tautomerase family protein [Pseudomonas sp. ZL2]